MITEKRFKEGFSYLELNFNLKFESDDMKKKYLKFVYQKTKDNFSDSDVEYGFTQMIRMTQKEWNKEYGYNGKPSIQDWVNFFNMKAKDARIAERDRKSVIAQKKAAIEMSTGISSRIEQKGDKAFASADKWDFIKNLSNRLTIN